MIIKTKTEFLKNPEGVTLLNHYLSQQLPKRFIYLFKTK